MSDMELEVQLAVLMRDLKYLTEKQDDMGAKITKLGTDVDDIKAMVQRWRGVTFFILSFGAFLGWVASTWGNISKALK
jgi:hypothetical protein